MRDLAELTHDGTLVVLVEVPHLHPALRLTLDAPHVSAAGADFSIQLRPIHG